MNYAEQIPIGEWLGIHDHRWVVMKTPVIFRKMEGDVTVFEREFTCPSCQKAQIMWIKPTHWLKPQMPEDI